MKTSELIAQLQETLTADGIALDRDVIVVIAPDGQPSLSRPVIIVDTCDIPGTLQIIGVKNENPQS